MRIVWVSFAPLRKTPASLTSDLASVRYRLALPAQAIAGSTLTHIGPGANRRTLLERFAGADAAVFGKVFDAALGEPALELAAALRQRGVKVIADFSDDNFAHPGIGPVQRAVANAADAVVASTPGLAAVLKEYTAAPVRVITDPVEGVRGAPRDSLRSPPRLLWFGHPLNLDTLRHALPQLAGYPLTVMTAAGAGAEGLGDRFRAWSTGALFEALAECDAAVLPSIPEDPRKAVKSPNRFTEALWAGRFVLAHPLPAYQALAPFGWVGEDLRDGLAWLGSHFEQAGERILAGQAWIEEHCSRAAVGRAWQAAVAAA